MRATVLVVALLAIACGDNNKQQPSDAGVDASGLVGCVDPALSMPPTDRLPCDLVPPGLAP